MPNQTKAEATSKPWRILDMDEYDALVKVAEMASVALQPYKRDITGKPTAEMQHNLCTALAALSALRNQK